MQIYRNVLIFFFIILPCPPSALGRISAIIFEVPRGRPKITEKMKTTMQKGNGVFRNWVHSTWCYAN